MSLLHDEFPDDRYDPAEIEEDQGVGEVEVHPSQVEAKVEEVIDITAETEVKSYAKAGEVEKARNATFVAAIKAGVPPEQAAELVATSLPVLMRDPMVQAKIQLLLDNWTLDAKTLKALSRARMAQIVVGGKDVDSVAAYRALSTDPELEMGGHGAVVQLNQQFNLTDDTRQAMEKNKSFDIPGLETKKDADAEQQ